MPGLARERRPLRLILGGLGLVLLLGVLLVALDRHPLRATWLDAEDPPTAAGERVGTPAHRDVAAPCLLVTDRARIAAAAGEHDFERMSWALGWSNLLEQELGHYAHLDSADLRPDAWAGRRVVVLAQGAATGLAQSARERAAAFVRAGGVLVLDRPGADWRQLSGIELSGAVVPRARVTAAIPRVLGEASLADLRRLPLPANLLPAAAGPDPGAEVVMEMDGHPALVARPVGAGLVVTVTFDLARALVVVQQGTPLGSDYRVGKRWGFYGHLVESHDLVWDESLLDDRVPVADVLERALLSAVRLGTPLPAWWPFPDGAEGLLLMTHDEDGYEARMCAPLLEHEVAIGAEATYFLIARRRVRESWPPEEVRRFTAAGADLELHWNRLPMVRGVWKIEPLEQVLALREQARTLRAALDAGGAPRTPYLNRNHYLMWASLKEDREGDTHYTRTFRQLAREGVVLDSTYGPNRGAKGYLFGTGRPFFPLDTDGTRLPLREVPFVSQEDWGGETEDWFRLLFEESRARYHCAIACIFHPHLIVLEEEGERLWKAVYSIAEEHGHPAIGMRTYHEFLEARRTSPLDYAVADDGTLTIEVEAAAPGLCVTLPASVATGAVLLDGEPLDTPPVLRSVDGLRQHLVPVPAGRHRIVARP